LRHAARLLRSHFEHSGDWLIAAARYHRPAGGLSAERYRKRFTRQLARVLQVSEDVLPTVLGQRVALR